VGICALIVRGPWLSPRSPFSGSCVSLFSFSPSCCVVRCSSRFLEYFAGSVKVHHRCSSEPPAGPSEERTDEEVVKGRAEDDRLAESSGSSDTAQSSSMSSESCRAYASVHKGGQSKRSNPSKKSWLTRTSDYSFFSRSSWPRWIVCGMCDRAAWRLHSERRAGCDITGHRGTGLDSGDFSGKGFYDRCGDQGLIS
jgi:hypothetical protein